MFENENQSQCYAWKRNIYLRNDVEGLNIKVLLYDNEIPEEKYFFCKKKRQRFARVFDS